MLKSFVFGLCLLCPIFTFGSTIPLYQIAAITERHLETFNGAHYEILASDEMEIETWNLGDNLRLEFLQTSVFWNPVYFYHDAFHRGFLISIVNTSHDNHRVTASLSLPPETPALGTYEIVSINRNLGEITLSNATLWHFDLLQVDQIPDWTPGQIVLIGKTPGYVTGDAFLLNVEVQNILAVTES